MKNIISQIKANKNDFLVVLFIQTTTIAVSFLLVPKILS
jgi:hypothetical protein